MAEATPAPSNGADPAATPWHKGAEFDPELSGFVENKGWKSPAAVAKSYRELEKLQRTPRERLLELPDKDDPAAWEPVYTRLGRPEKPEGYELPAPQLEEGQWDVTKDFRGVAHEAGLSGKQAKVIVEKLAARAAEHQKVQDEQAAARAEADLQALKREWGGEFDKNLRFAREISSRVQGALGYKSVDELNADLSKVEAQLGTGRFLKLFSFLGRGLGEHSFEGNERPGATQPFGMTPDRAKAAITSLRSDKSFVDALLDTGHVGHKAAKDKMSELHKVAYPEA